MKDILSKLSYIGLFLSIISSCQSKEEKKQTNNSSNSNSENIISDLYAGKWFSINKEGDKYYYCTDGDKFFEINKNKIYDHTPMEDSNFNIDHIKQKGNQTFFYIDKQESSYYILSWIDKNKGIVLYQFNNYKPSLFITEKKIKSIENKVCQSKAKSCEFTNLSNKYKFVLEAGEYKEEKYPISALIVVTNKKNGKSQDIYFEPNSWATYSDLPCNSFFVKDFNFDGLEDFAIVWDQGGNAGKLYEYYFQDKNGIFSTIDSFPLQHGMLAEDINVTNKTITTQSIAGCCHINLNKYKLNSNGSWETSSEQHELNKN